MSWSEVKKINSDLSEPLDTKIANAKNTLANMFGLQLVSRYKATNTMQSFTPSDNGILSVCLYGGSNSYVEVGLNINTSGGIADEIIKCSKDDQAVATVPVKKGETIYYRSNNDSNTISLYKWGGTT